MSKSIRFFSCAVLFAVSSFGALPTLAKPIQLAQGAVGAPVGGGTGTGGNAGVGDHDAGTDKADTYNSSANPMQTTTSGHSRHHRRSSDSRLTNPSEVQPTDTTTKPGAAGAQ